MYKISLVEIMAAIFCLFFIKEIAIILIATLASFLFMWGFIFTGAMICHIYFYPIEQMQMRWQNKNPILFYMGMITYVVSSLSFLLFFPIN